MTAGPLDGWDECTKTGCPSWDDTATAEAVREFEDSGGWAHGRSTFTTSTTTS